MRVLRQDQLQHLFDGLTTRGFTLIVNLPGSPSAATESLDAIAKLIPHALDLLSGNTDHTPGAIRSRSHPTANRIG